MALKKSEKRLLLILGVVVAVFLVNQIISGGKKKAVPLKNATATKIESTSPPIKDGTKTVGTSVQNATVNGKVSYDTWGRDPFSLPSVYMPLVADTVKSNLQLKGIIRKGQRLYALINDQIIGLGEEKAGIRVERIEGKTVVCVQNGVRVTLEWKG